MKGYLVTYGNWWCKNDEKSEVNNTFLDPGRIEANEPNDIYVGGSSSTIRYIR